MIGQPEVTRAEGRALRYDWELALSVLLAITQATQNRPTRLQNPDELVADLTGTRWEGVGDARVRAVTSDYLVPGPDRRDTLNPDSVRAAEIAGATLFETRTGEPLSRDDLMIAIGQQLAAEIVQASIGIREPAN